MRRAIERSLGTSIVARHAGARRRRRGGVRGRSRRRPARVRQDARDGAARFLHDRGDGSRVAARRRRDPGTGGARRRRRAAESSRARMDRRGPAGADDGAGVRRARSAALHRAGAPSFGREDRRTTGSRGLPNEPCATWAEFYADRPAAAARASWRASRTRSRRRRSPRSSSSPAASTEFGGPDEPPARLHGDLWAGNRLVDTDGRSWLIDPAAHGGHREFDLAMMRLFGGFGDDVLRRVRRRVPARRRLARARRARTRSRRWSCTRSSSVAATSAPRRTRSTSTAEAVATSRSVPYSPTSTDRPENAR